MATLTIADLDNGKRDLETVDAVANSQADTTTTRYGDSVLTLAGALRRLGYPPPVPYAPGLNVDSPVFTVEFGDPAVVYRPDPALVPFTTGAWNPDQWRVVQNNNLGDFLMVFSTLAAAESAAALSPDGQIIEAAGFRYTVQSGLLTDKRAAEQVRSDLENPTGLEPVGGFDSYAGLETYAGDATSAKVFQRQYLRQSVPSVADGVLMINDALGRTWACHFDGRAHISWWIEKYPDHRQALEAAIKTGVPLAFAGSDLNLAGSSVFEAPGDVDLDFSGATVTVGNNQIFISAKKVASAITLAADVSRLSRGITVGGDLSGVSEGDVIHIISDALPSPSWSDKKQDCLLVKNAGGGAINFYDQLNFPYVAGEPGLTITVYKRAAVRVVGLSSTHTFESSPSYAIGFQGFSKVSLERPAFTGTLPFDPVLNIYRTGILLDRCRNIDISGQTAKNMAYPIGIYGGSRGISEVGTSGEGNHHLNADLGGWASDYELVGMTGSSNYQGLNTHPCIRANASNVSLTGELGLSNWRACGGFTLSNIRVSGYATDDMELPQFANTQVNSGFEFLNSEADIFIDGFHANHPSRIAKPVMAVRFARTATYSRVSSNQPVWAGMSSGELGTYIQGFGCQFGAGKLASLDAASVFATAWRSDLPGLDLITAAQTIRLPAGCVSVSLTGTTKVQTVLSSGLAGQSVRLFFLNSGGGVTAGGNILGTPPATPASGHVDLVGIGGGQYFISTV